MTEEENNQQVYQQNDQPNDQLNEQPNDQQNIQNEQANFQENDQANFQENNQPGEQLDNQNNEKDIPQNTDYQNEENVQNYQNEQNMAYEESNNNNYPRCGMQVSNPQVIDGVLKYISYTLSGSDISSQLARRYSDFYALRERLTEDFPGIFIPNVPPKKMLGNMNKNYINKRLRLLNIFCEKLSKFPFLWTSETVVRFQTLNGEFSKLIDKSPKENIINILNKYKNCFKGYTSAYDIILGKSKMSEFLNFFKRVERTIKTFHDLVLQCLEKRDKRIAQYIELIKQFENYERYVLIQYTDNNEEKLYIFNPKYSAIKDKISKLEQTLSNQFVALDEWLEEEELDIGAAIDALNSLNRLLVGVDRLQKKIDNITNDIKLLTYGKQNFISEFFTKKEDKLASLEKQKNDSQDELDALDQVSKIAHYYMEGFFVEFQKERLKGYYKAVKKFAEIQKNNSKNDEELWIEIKKCLAESKEK